MDTRSKAVPMHEWRMNYMTQQRRTLSLSLLELSIDIHGSTDCAQTLKPQTPKWDRK